MKGLHPAIKESCSRFTRKCDDPCVVWMDGKRLREMAFGLTHTPENMLLDAELDDVVAPASQFCHDWMHMFYVNGVFNVVIQLTLKAAKDHRPTRDIYSRLRAYVAMWILPRRLGGVGSVAALFSAKRERANDKARAFKCQASDGLTLTPIIAFFVRKVWRTR